MTAFWERDEPENADPEHGRLVDKREIASRIPCLSKIYLEPAQFWYLFDPWPYFSSFSFVSVLGVAGWHPGSQTPLSSTPILCLIFPAQLCLADPAPLPQTDYLRLHFSGGASWDNLWPSHFVFSRPMCVGRTSPPCLRSQGVVVKKSPELEWQIEFALRKRHHSCLLRSSRQWEQEAKE